MKTRHHLQELRIVTSPALVLQPWPVLPSLQPSEHLPSVTLQQRLCHFT